MNYLVKLLTKMKSQINNFTIFLETFKYISINFQANIKSSGNDSLTTKFYKQLSNGLFSVI